MTQLICAVSFDKETLCITVHNLCPDLELTSPVYSSNGATYCTFPNQHTDTGDTIEASFGIDSKQKDFKCALLYKLQRKYTIRDDNQPNNSKASIENTDMYLLVIWNAEFYYHGYCACLIECTDDFTWDEDKLWALYWKYNGQAYMNHTSSINTWLMNDGTVIKMRRDVTYESDYKLNIIMSEGTGKCHMKKSIQIDPKRSVSLL
jgi:hypothetical protein